MLMAFEKAATAQNISRQTIIIAGSEPCQLDRLFEEVARAIGTDFRTVTIPLSVMAPVCWVFEKLWGTLRKDPPFSTRSLKFFTESSAYDISKARDLLDYVPTVDLADGLALTAQELSREGLL